MLNVFFQRWWKTVFVTLGITSCANTYYAQKNGEATINILVVGDKSLNQYKLKAHPLVVDIYQLKNLDELRLLNKQTNYEEVKKLFESKLNPLALNSIILLPGMAKRLNLSAEKSCSYLVIVAGYYVSANRDDFIAIYPVASYKKSIFGYEYGRNIGPEIYMRFGEEKII